MTSTLHGRVNGEPRTIRVTDRSIELGPWSTPIPMDGIESARLDMAQRRLTIVLTQTATFNRTDAYGSQTFDIDFAATDSESFVRLQRTIATAIRGNR